MQPVNFIGFARWMIARINTISRLMAERSTMYQTTISGNAVVRHTPAQDLKVYMSAKIMDQMDAMALSLTYHDEYLKLADVEGVAYWQAIGTPESVTGKPTYTNTSGVVTTPGTASTVSNIVGLMFDRDALGMASILEETSITPFNARGRYWNNFYHNKVKTRMDMTEKMVLLTLD